MSCYYRNGNNCELCGRYGYPNISDAEQFTWQRCSDDYNYCPVAYAFMEGERQFYEEEEKQEKERKRQEEERKKQEEENRKQQEEIEEPHPEPEPPIPVPEPPIVPENHVVPIYGLKHFFSDMWEGNLLRFLLSLGLALGIIIAFTAVGGYCVVLLLPAKFFSQVAESEFLTNMLYCSIYAGVLVLIITVYRFHGSTGLLMIVVPIALTYLYAIMKSILKNARVVEIIFLVIIRAWDILVLSAGLLPGLLFAFVRMIIPDTLFAGAQWVLSIAAALAASVLVGFFLSNLICRVLNYFMICRENKLN